MERSKFKCASTGMFKSENEKVDCAAIADRNDCALVVLDGKGTLARSLAGHFVAGGWERRVVSDEYASKDGKVLASEYLPRVEEADAFRRETEEAIIREEFNQIFLAVKGVGAYDPAPYTREVGELFTRALQKQSPPKTLDWLKFFWQPRTGQYQRLMEECTELETRQRLFDARLLAHRSPTQYEAWVGSFRRMAQSALDAPAFLARCRPEPGRGIDMTQALREKKLILLSGASVPRASARFLFLATALQVVNACRRFHGRFGRALPVVLVLEECGAYGLAAPFILMALQELRAAGFAAHVLTQSTMDFEPAVGDKILQNTPGGHYWGKLLSSEDQDKAAADLANVTFDPMAVLSTRTRQVHAGMESYHHTIRGQSRDDAGNVRRDERDAVNFLPHYREEIDVMYKTPQLQSQEYKTAVANLRVGEFFLRSMDGVHKIKGKMLGDAWPFGLTERRIQQALARIRSQAIYQEARLPEPPPAPTPPAPPTRAPRATATERLAGNGTSGS